MFSPSAQLSDPQHQYLELSKGHYFSHGSVSWSAESPFRGPIRLTLAAGESMLKWAKKNGYQSARLVPAETTFIR